MYEWHKYIVYLLFVYPQCQRREEFLSWETQDLDIKLRKAYHNMYEYIGLGFAF